MAERSFQKEVKSLQLGAGEQFRGEGILAVAKALLQSGVSYVGGYQGAPVSHLMDVFADAKDVLNDLGVHFENCANEAGAAAMLGASINYPIRGAVTWKSTVGTNVASDALSNLASAGVKGGALIILGEDYGEGASIIQERSHAFAMKSQIWLLDPRPNLPKLVEMVEKGFELSEASATPVMLEMRIRACHVYGQFDTRDNVAGAVSSLSPLEEATFDYGKICLPPSTYIQEQDKITRRMPAALDYIKKAKLNETFGEPGDVGIILQGGLYNGVNRALEQLGLSDPYGASKLPLFVLNVTYPLVPGEIEDFCKDKTSVLVVEESQPDFLAQAIKSILRDGNIDTAIHGKNYLPMAGEYSGQVLFEGIAHFLQDLAWTGIDPTVLETIYGNHRKNLAKAAGVFMDPLPIRPPGFCTGCPERPVFTAMKLVERQIGKFHVSADIGCHTFATLPPFNIGNTVMGYGLGLSGSTGIAPNMKKRTASIMGDGGFWHNGLTSGIANAVFNKDDSVLVILDNGYTAATGHQEIPTSRIESTDRSANLDMNKALNAVGVNWIKRVRSYGVAEMATVFKDAMTTGDKGLKVIIAEGECMLAVQRRKKPADAKQKLDGNRVIKNIFAVDENLCTGDHSCIRLSGCPTLSVKPNPDPLRKDPVTFVDNGCVGCGNCGETAHAASLCPSFYEIRTISNPTLWERLLDRLRTLLIAPLRSSGQGG